MAHLRHISLFWTTELYRVSAHSVKKMAVKSVSAKLRKSLKNEKTTHWLIARSRFKYRRFSFDFSLGMLRCSASLQSQMMRLTQRLRLYRCVWMWYYLTHTSARDCRCGVTCVSFLIFSVEYSCFKHIYSFIQRVSTPQLFHASSFHFTSLRLGLFRTSFTLILFHSYFLSFSLSQFYFFALNPHCLSSGGENSLPWHCFSSESHSSFDFTIFIRSFFSERPRFSVSWQFVSELGGRSFWLLLNSRLAYSS